LGNSLFICKGSSDYKLHIADRRKLCSWIHSYSDHKNVVADLKWISDSVIATASWYDAELYIWVTRKRDFTSLIYDINKNTKQSLQFCGKGIAVETLDRGILVTGHTDNCMSLWDLSNNREICSLVCSQELITTDSFKLGKSEKYLSGRVHSNVAVYDLQKFENFITFQNLIYK
jgi:WD40 repeat protein